MRSGATSALSIVAEEKDEDEDDGGGWRWRRSDCGGGGSWLVSAAEGVDGDACVAGGGGRWCCDGEVGLATGIVEQGFFFHCNIFFC